MIKQIINLIGLLIWSELIPYSENSLTAGGCSSTTIASRSADTVIRYKSVTAEENCPDLLQLLEPGRLQLANFEHGNVRDFPITGHCRPIRTHKPIPTHSTLLHGLKKFRTTVIFSNNSNKSGPILISFGHHHHHVRLMEVVKHNDTKQLTNLLKVRKTYFKYSICSVIQLIGLR